MSEINSNRKHNVYKPTWWNIGRGNKIYSADWSGNDEQNQSFEEKKWLLDHQKQSYKILNDIDNYFLGDNELLYHVYKPRKSCTEGFYKRMVLPETFHADIVLLHVQVLG